MVCLEFIICLYLDWFRMVVYFFFIVWNFLCNICFFCWLCLFGLVILLLISLLWGLFSLLRLVFFVGCWLVWC